MIDKTKRRTDLHSYCGDWGNFETGQERAVGNGCDPVNPVRLGDRWATAIGDVAEAKAGDPAVEGQPKIGVLFLLHTCRRATERCPPSKLLAQICVAAAGLARSPN